MKFLPVVINGSLALLWGAMYATTLLPYLLFASGVAAGKAVVMLLLAVSDRR